MWRTALHPIHPASALPAPHLCGHQHQAAVAQHAEQQLRVGAALGVLRPQRKLRLELPGLLGQGGMGR